MGSVFQNKDTNNIAKIDNHNISTKNFTNHISSLGISSEVIRNNLDQNILEEILSDLLAKKFIELEIDYYDISISDEQLVKIIKKNKNFLDEKSKFDRIKYEKFLIENNINPSDFEKRLKNRELEKKLFFLLNGGINSPEFMVKKYYKYENSKIDLRFINLDNFYKKKIRAKKEIRLIIKDDFIIAADNFGYVYSINYKKNKINWAKNFLVPFRSNLKIINDILFLSDEKNKIILIDSNKLIS